MRSLCHRVTSIRGETQSIVLAFAQLFLAGFYWKGLPEMTQKPTRVNLKKAEKRLKKSENLKRKPKNSRNELQPSFLRRFWSLQCELSFSVLVKSIFRAFFYRFCRSFLSCKCFMWHDSCLDISFYSKTPGFLFDYLFFFLFDSYFFYSLFCCCFAQCILLLLLLLLRSN